MEQGDNYEELYQYVETNFPESGVSWSDGVSTIPGSQYQVHILHRGSQLVRNNEGLWLQTENGSTVEDAAHNLLKLLKEREETVIPIDVKNEGYGEKGFIVETEILPEDDDELYRVSVHLSEEFCANRGNFVLGTATRKSAGIAAHEVLKILQFKKSKGYMWVDEILYKEALVKYKSEAEASRLLKEQKELRKKGRDLTPEEIDRINKNESTPHVAWLGQEFHGPPSFFSGQLPKLSEEIHKVLRKHGYLLDPVDERKLVSMPGGGGTAPPGPLIAYEAVEAYERVYKEMVERRTEAKEKSRISRLSRRVGLRQ